MKYTFLLILALMCSTLQAKPNSSRDTIEVENENIKYRFTSDTNNLYLNIRTTDRKVMMSMLRSGVLVYFDTKGKKKKNVYVKYPYNSVKPDRDRKSSRTDQKPLEFSEMIKSLSKQAEYKHFKNSQKFHIDLNTQNITLGFDFNKKEEVLEYRLIIPKEHVTANNELELSKLSIGIAIGSKNEEQRRQRSGQQRQVGSTNSGQKGAGSGRGGRSRGSRGGSGQGRPSNNSKQQERPSSTAIDFWFDAVSEK